MNSTCSTTSWTERIVRRVAGTMVLVSVALAWKVHPGWLGLGAFVGLNLLQSSFTGLCPLESVLRRVEARRDPSATQSQA